ncbi:MAG TPA: FtsW/RodA/SpoVE family cell cycle protein [Candidatus Babeliales bacterium]|jgi:rod shape determining protein RodA|nr:FtsW/RodA/SpoVE family cell cycle protein [Candidatus Babeliales bacterium]
MNIRYNTAVRSFDFVTCILMLLLAACGLLFIFSATYSSEQPFSYFFIKQCLGICSGIIIYFLCLIPDYRTIMRWGSVAYFIIIALLVFTLIKGSIGMGAKRWINLFFFKFQPSELTKLLFPAYMVNYLHMKKKIVIHTFHTFAPLLTMLAISFILILKQPDLGTALIIIFSGLILCWIAGLPKKFFVYGLLITLIAAPAIWSFVLRDYQKNRIIVFLGQGDQKKEGYQIEQASIAIGSGGLFGKGLCNGTQNRLRFLPESRTDCIFAVLCEELGLAGALFIILCYLLLFLRSFFLITTLKDMYAQIFAIGLILHILLATIINIGMVLGMLPVVGIPLPLMSYGLCNLWITIASLGIFQNIVIHCR